MLLEIPMAKGIQGRHLLSTTSLPILVGGAIVLAVTLRIAASLSEDPDLVEWSFTHWAFTYEHGLTKRALVGEVVSWFVPPPVSS